MAETNGNGSRSHWVAIIVAIAGGLIGYGSLQSKVGDLTDSLRQNWANDTAFREGFNNTDRVFREKVVADLAELRANTTLLLQERAKKP